MKDDEVTICSVLAALSLIVMVCMILWGVAELTMQLWGDGMRGVAIFIDALLVFSISCAIMFRNE